jgi:N utilization substance protein A
MENIQGMLAKKSEGRPLTPEEYDRMAKFVDSVEKRVMVKKPVEKKVEDKQRQEVRKTISPVAFEQGILDSGLPEHAAYTLQENGLSTVGDLVMQMKIEPDDVLKLQGIGPRAMAEINRLVETMSTKPAEEAATASAETGAAEAPVTEGTPPAGSEHVIATPVDEIVQQAAEEPAVAEDITITPPSPVQEAAAVEAAAETADAETAKVETEAEAAETAVEAKTTEAGEPVGEETSFDELFTLRPEVVADEAPAEEEEEEAGKGDKKKGKKKGKKHVEIEFDPEAGRTFAKKKHKRGGEDWDWG